ncbi:hypothetical protein [Alkalicoccus saliphilus]|uniref:Uncharacterized protein n=1 Tax=Alkalicoccus saliphilus TaxID=200989 RepID=A0A2T4U3Z7_9BACI|nr:hypothetical protein [Alkalicoccus saliphilus]PTL38109.1 hypothetical protein C6Y45_13015 [Alkalicoccus saliphilus]
MKEFSRKSIRGVTIRGFIDFLEQWDNSSDVIIRFRAHNKKIAEGNAKLNCKATLSDIHFTAYYMMYLEAVSYLRYEFQFWEIPTHVFNKEFDDKIFKGNRIIKFFNFLKFKNVYLRSQADWIESNDFGKTYLHAQNDGIALAISHIEMQTKSFFRISKEEMV